MRLIENDDRAVIGHANYPRVTPSNVDPYVPMGPNYMGEFMWPVAATKTQIGFSLVPPPEVEE